jgi:hypothetical protein
MKIIIFCCISILASNFRAQNIQTNKVNLFTLKVDFMTNNFEGGNLAYYDCVACVNDSLPLEVIYNSPGDFGDIRFKLNESSETIFSASIIWMGEGDIDLPQTFVNTEPFIDQQIPFALPSNVRVYDEEGSITSNSTLVQMAQGAWTSVEALGIVRQALEDNFKVGMSVYTPSVGMTNWSVAKWIIFLYKNTAYNSVQELENEIKIYPNPAQKELNLNLDNFENKSYILKSIDGKIVRQSNIVSNNINVSSLLEGIYFIEIREKDKLIGNWKFQKN